MEILNILGLLFNFVGILLIYNNQPKNFDIIDSNGANKRKSSDKNKLVDLGTVFLVLGVVLQILYTMLWEK